jgi:hypothetical protein
MGAQEIATLWLCSNCREEAEANPRIMSGNILTANWGDGQGFRDFSRDRCDYCNTAQAGYRHRFTLWGN